MIGIFALFFCLVGAAVAQPGPGPAPDPWVVNGSGISYNGCALVPSSVSGGCKGNGTINATAIYQAGFQVLGTLANGKIFVGNASAVGIAQTPSGDLTMTNTGIFTVSANVVTNAKLAQASTATLKGNPTNATANVQDFTLSSLTALASPSTTLDLVLIWDHTAGTFKSATPSALSTAVGGITALTGDVSASGPGSVAATLATVNSNIGSFGSATQAGTFTVNGKGLVTAAANVTITPAIGSITGLGTGVATALGVNVGSAGAFVTFNGAGGTPSSLVGTNITGTAAGLIAGNVTTNANLTGVITSVGNATSIASQTGTGTKFVVDTSPTIAGLTVTGSFTATGLVTNADLAGSIAASKLIGTDIATVGTLTAGAASTGFTIQASNVTVTGTFAGANVAAVANASGSPSATFGVMKADGTTIQCTSGTCSAVGGVATSIQNGVTMITSGTDTRVLFQNTGGILGQYVITGTGNVMMSASPTTTGTLTAAAANFSGTVNLAGTVQVAGNAMTFPAAAATIPQIIASGAKALATSAIGSGACSSAQTDTATGATTTDAPSFTFASDPTAVTGYSPSTSGMLAIIPWVTSGTINFKVCNNTAASITPGAISINWRVIR